MGSGKVRKIKATLATGEIKEALAMHPEMSVYDRVLDGDSSRR